LKIGNAIYKLTTKILNAANNKLIVGGIFYDLEKVFDCVDHGILLSKLNFYGINGKVQALYQSYLENRYFRTAIYNNINNSNKVSSCAKVRHGVPQGSVLGLLLFFLHIYELPKETDKTSAPTIFVDDTSILLAHSNLIYFYSNIHIAFKTFNEWFQVNQLSLHFNKTNYIHFVSKRNMSVNLKIGLNNNLITNSSYTKFVGLKMDCKLSWNNHIDLFIVKFSTVFYIISNVKTYMFTSALKIICHAFLYLAVSYEIIFCRNLLQSSTIKKKKKKAIRIMEGCGNRVSCRNLFKKLKILLLMSQYLLSLLMFIVQNKNLFSTNIKNYNIDTKQRNYLYILQIDLAMYQKGAYYSWIKIFSNLSMVIQNDADNLKKFKLTLKQFLYNYSFYTLEEYSNQS
jgi:hypothetical protein